MILGIEILWVLILVFLFYQDLKERKLTVLLLLLGIFLGGLVNYLHQQPIVFLSNVLMNCAFVGVIFGILGLYAKFKMQQPIFEVFGKGDLGFFILMTLSLPSLSFLMVFIFSTFFALLVFLLFKRKFSAKTVPLAGLQSLFLALVIIANKFMSSLHIYAI